MRIVKGVVLFLLFLVSFSGPCAASDGFVSQRLVHRRHNRLIGKTPRTVLGHRHQARQRSETAKPKTPNSATSAPIIPCRVEVPRCP